MPTRHPTMPPVRTEIQCEVNGKTYEGKYHVNKGVLYVDCAYGSKNAHGSSASEVIAKMVLAEIVRDAISKGHA